MKPLGHQSARFPNWVTRYESAMIVVGVVGPFATLPQIFKLYVSHSQHAPGQSLTTWALYALLSVLWFIYGILEKKSAIWLGNGISGILNFLMVVGILLQAGLTF